MCDKIANYHLMLRVFAVKVSRVLFQLLRELVGDPQTYQTKILEFLDSALLIITCRITRIKSTVCQLFIKSAIKQIVLCRKQVLIHRFMIPEWRHNQRNTIFCVEHTFVYFIPLLIYICDFRLWEIFHEKWKKKIPSEIC